MPAMDELEIDDRYRKLAEEMAQLQTACHQNSKDKGFWDATQNIGEKIALIHSELSEALEVYRDGKALNVTWFDKDKVGRMKPEGFGAEMADAVIRIMDLCEFLGIPLAVRMIGKMEYNRGRNPMHGKVC